MVRAIDLYESIENETLRRFSDLRGILDDPSLEVNTLGYLATLRDAMERLEGEFDQPSSPEGTLAYIASGYGSGCQSFEAATQRYESTRSAADYAESVNWLFTVEESDALPVITSVKFLNSMYFGFRELAEYLDSTKELVDRARKTILQEQPQTSLSS